MEDAEKGGDPVKPDDGDNNDDDDDGDKPKPKDDNDEPPTQPGKEETLDYSECIST